jgi:hypothetical protein
MRKIKTIGIIAEDNSDFATARKLILRITNRRLKFKKQIGDGSGKLKRKADDYCTVLHARGCDAVILLHDLDRNQLQGLKAELEQKILNSPVKIKFVCIPVEEIEAWIISDPLAIKQALNLRRLPKFSGKPESVTSPKEKLQNEIKRCANNSFTYITTVHNEKIAEHLSIDAAKTKCPSFALFYNFIKTRLT